jgi:hypothetical protein
MPDPIKPQDPAIPSPHKKESPESKPQAPAPLPKKKKEEEKKNEEEEDSGYKMLDIAWKAFDASKNIHINLANMAWDNVLKDPYNAAKTAVKDKVSELGSAALNAVGEVGNIALGKASEAAYDLRDFMKRTSEKDNQDDNDVEMEDFESDDDSADETELDDFVADSSEDEEEMDDFAADDSEDEDSDADWGNEAESGGIPMTPTQAKPPPMTSMQTTASPNPGKSSKNAASKQDMPKGADSSSKGAGKEDLSEEVVKGAEMGM